MISLHFNRDGFDETKFKYINEKVKSKEEIKIVIDNLNAVKENYEILNDEDYIGNIILFNEDITNFWEIYILIFPEFRGNKYAKSALEQLIKLHPSRNWEIQISEKDKNIHNMQDYLLNFGFEKIELGYSNDPDGITYSFKKAKELSITVIGSSYFAPIADLLNNLLKRSSGKINELQASNLENGYSVSVCILLVACFESYVRSDFYFRKENQKNILEFIKKYYLDFPYLNEITECYIVRDLILHNHIWEIEHSYYELNIINSDLTPFSGDKKFKKNIDEINMVTNKLKLNINPIRINRKDVKKVFQFIWESLLFLSNNKDSHIQLFYLPVYFDGKILKFNEVYNIFMAHA
jgi:hypothetical protein